MSKDVSVCAVIVTYNRLDVLKNSLAGIVAQTAKISTILVVDNNSTDGTREYLISLHGQNNIRSVHISEISGMPVELNGELHMHYGQGSMIISG